MQSQAAGPHHSLSAPKPRFKPVHRLFVIGDGVCSFSWRYSRALSCTYDLIVQVAAWLRALRVPASRCLDFICTRSLCVPRQRVPEYEAVAPRRRALVGYGPPRRLRSRQSGGRAGCTASIAARRRTLRSQLPPQSAPLMPYGTVGSGGFSQLMSQCQSQSSVSTGLWQFNSVT